MPLCKCSLCSASTNGRGKNLHRSTIIRHMERDQRNQEFESQYRESHPEEEFEDFMNVDEEQKLGNDNEESHIEEMSLSYNDNEVSHGYNPPHPPHPSPEYYDDNEVSYEHNSPSESYDDEVFLSDFCEHDYDYHENDCQSESELDEPGNDEMTSSEESLIEGLRLLYVKSNFNFSEAAFNDIIKVFRNNCEISLFKIKNKLKLIVGIEPQIYDMCVNSCCAFTGDFENESKCRYCSKSRYYAGKARKHLPYISIIERLKLQFKNSQRSRELLYRYNYTYNKENLFHDDIGDIFDGQIYRELLDSGYFPDSRDIAFSASCDGYQIFRQKTDDCWVFLFLNNNLPQELRVKKENLMITLIIPGPKQPQDFNSFLYPLIQEMKALQGKT